MLLDLMENTDSHRLKHRKHILSELSTREKRAPGLALFSVLCAVVLGSTGLGGDLFEPWSDAYS